MTDTGTVLEESPELLPRAADKPKGLVPEGKGAAGTQHLKAFPTGGEGSWQRPCVTCSAQYWAVRDFS